MNCLLIDDDPNALAVLTEYVDQYQGLQIMKKYTQPLLVLKEINALPLLDIVFLDVDMPLMSGLELAQAIRHKTKVLIFTTSHSKYAIDAYDLHAEAYLLKPFSFSKFATTINNVISKIAFEPGSEESNDDKAVDDYIFVRSLDEDKRMRRLSLHDIIAFESRGNYIKIHTEQLEEPLICYLTIKDVMAMVHERQIEYLVQVHRGYVISVHFIRYMEGNQIYMKKGLKVTAGRNYKAVFQSFITDKMLTTRRRR